MSLKVFENNQLVDINGISVFEKTEKIIPYLDGKTRLWIEIPNDDKTVHLRLGVAGTATINWGDDTATTTIIGSNVNTYQINDHTYKSGGRYTILIENTGNIQFGGNSFDGSLIFVSDTLYTTNHSRYAYANRIIRGIEIGDNTWLDVCAIDKLSIEMLAAYGRNIVYNTTQGTCSVLSLYTATDFDVDISNARSIVFGNAKETFPSNRLTTCYKVTDVVIPANVTSMGNDVLRYNFFKTVTFQPIIPPILSSDNLFSDADPKRLTIKVPRGCLEAYTSAQYYPDPNIFTYEEYDL